MIKRKQSIIFVVLMLGLLTMVGVIGVVKTGEKKTPLPLEKNAVDLPEASLPEGSGQKQNETSAQGSIAVPGTEKMIFKADQKKQEVNLYNPGKNNCYFRISILLEDETLLFQSGLISPGKGLYDIELKKALLEGEYPNSILRYECFSEDEQLTPLHRAEIVFTIQSNP